MWLKWRFRKITVEIAKRTDYRRLEGKERFCSCNKASVRSLDKDGWLQWELGMAFWRKDKSSYLSGSGEPKDINKTLHFWLCILEAWNIQWIRVREELNVLGWKWRWDSQVLYWGMSSGRIGSPGLGWKWEFQNREGSWSCENQKRKHT